MINIRDCARSLRDDLAAAGVGGSDLFVEGDPLQQHLTFHHLRDTGLTWMAVRGDDPVRIQWRAGDAQLSMTEEYIAAGRNVGAGFGRPFPPPPLNLIDPKTPAPRPLDQALDQPTRRKYIFAQKVASPTGFEPVLAT
jgi:hypothetical protein